MTVPLIDMRSKITMRTDSVLTAHAIAQRTSKAVIVRQVLDHWATTQQTAADQLGRLTRGQGGESA